MTFRCCLSSRSCPKNIMSMVPKPHCQSKFIDDPKQIAILLTNQVQCINLLHCRNLASSHQSLFISRSWCYNDIRGWRCSQTHWWPHPLTCFCHAPLSAKRFSMSACYYFHDLWTASTGRAEERVAKLVDSPDRPESEASYKLDEGGWSDV